VATAGPAAGRPRISAAVICLNEAEHIAACLDSVAWCDEIVVVDAGSSDGTVELARKRATRVEHRDWPGYAAQKNRALELTTGDWVLCLDADERCTPGLRDAVRAAVSAPAGAVGFEVRRHTFYLGHWIDHGGWYPDWKLRVVRRGRGRWGGIDPHDKLEAEGPIRRLDAELIHLTYRDVAEHLRAVQRYSDLAVDDWTRRGRRFRLAMAVLHPPVKFLQVWVWKRGFLDGWPGFVIATTSAFYVFAKYVKLWERSRSAAMRRT
jgi:glycosyltransferase involved in cell wall biosynthesis